MVYCKGVRWLSVIGFGVIWVIDHDVIRSDESEAPASQDEELCCELWQ